MGRSMPSRSTDSFVVAGTYESLAFEHKKESTKKREAFFIEFAEALKPVIQRATICVTGGFRSKAAMEQAISEGSTDLVGLARPLCSEPYLIRDIVEGKSEGAKENKSVSLWSASVMPPAGAADR